MSEKKKQKQVKSPGMFSRPLCPPKAGSGRDIYDIKSAHKYVLVNIVLDRPIMRILHGL